MGAIYMVLTFSIMVPMVLLTDAIINYLSAELQTNDSDIQAGIRARFVSSLLTDSCPQALNHGIEEVIVGDATRTVDGFAEGKVRYFIFNVQPDLPDQRGSAYVLRGLTDQKKQPKLSLDDMLPIPKSDAKTDCSSSSYKSPVFTRYAVCPVPERRMLSGTSADWRWKWLDDGEEPSTSRDYLHCPDGLLLTRK